MVIELSLLLVTARLNLKLGHTMGAQFIKIIPVNQLLNKSKLIGGSDVRHCRRGWLQSNSLQMHHTAY